MIPGPGAEALTGEDRGSLDSKFIPPKYFETCVPYEEFELRLSNSMDESTISVLSLSTLSLSVHLYLNVILTYKKKTAL